MIKKCFGNLNCSTMFGPMALSGTQAKFNLAEKQISNFQTTNYWVFSNSIIAHQTSNCTAVQYNSH